MCRAGDWNPVEQSIEGLYSLSTHQIYLTGAGISFHWQQEHCSPGVLRGMLMLHWKQSTWTPVHSYGVVAKVNLQARDKLP